jgi:hypothetical protein
MFKSTQSYRNHSRNWFPQLELFDFHIFFHNLMQLVGMSALIFILTLKRVGGQNYKLQTYCPPFENCFVDCFCQYHLTSPLQQKDKTVIMFVNDHKRAAQEGHSSIVSYSTLIVEGSVIFINIYLQTLQKSIHSLKSLLYGWVFRIPIYLNLNFLN